MPNQRPPHLTIHVKSRESPRDPDIQAVSPEVAARVCEVGDVFVVSCGEYSDYGIITIVRVCERFTLGAVIADFLTSHPRASEPYGFNEQAFLTHLTTRGLVEEMTVPWKELYLPGSLRGLYVSDRWP